MAHAHTTSGHQHASLPKHQPGGPRTTSSPPRGPIDLSEHPLVDADHIAAVLCVKRKRVYELARRHRDPLPSVRIGGAVRFVVAQVEEWVAAQSV
jgi:excisionase family DNA binding protein